MYDLVRAAKSWGITDPTSLRDLSPEAKALILATEKADQLVEFVSYYGEEFNDLIQPRIGSTN